MAVCPAKFECMGNLTSYGFGLVPSIVSIASSTLSCMGALIILSQRALAIIIGSKSSSRPGVLRLRHGPLDIVAMWAVAELITAVSYIAAGVNFIAAFNTAASNEAENQCPEAFRTVCEIQSFVTTWFSTSANLWTCIFAVHYLILPFADGVFIPRICFNILNMPLYNCIAWITPLVMALPLLLTGKLGFSYYGAANWCFIEGSIEGYPSVSLIVILIVAGPLWVVLAFIVCVTSYFVLRMLLSRYELQRGGFRGMVIPLNQQLLPIPIFLLLMRAWGVIQSVASLQVINGGCISHGTHTLFFVLEILQAIGEGGQGTFLYFFFVPQLVKWCWSSWPNGVIQTTAAVSAPSLNDRMVRVPPQLPPPLVITRMYIGRSSSSAVVSAGTSTTDTAVVTSELRPIAEDEREEAMRRMSIDPVILPRLSLLDMSTLFMELRAHVLHTAIVRKLNIEDFQHFLARLPVFTAVKVQQKFFDKMKIFQFRTLPKLVYYLDEFWDYINCDLLQKVVTEIGDDQLSYRMEEYRAKLAQVKNETTAEEFALQVRDHPQLQIVRSETSFTEVFIRLNAKWNKYTLLDADRLQQSIISTYSLASYSVSFCNVYEGTILIKIWLKSECVPVIIHTEKMPEIFHRAKVLEVFLDGIPMQFCRSRVAKIEVTDLTPTPPQTREEVYAITSEQVDTSSLDTTHLHDLLCETVSIVLEWYNLGLALGLLPHTLDAIKSQNADPFTCRCTMLNDWLKKKDQVPQNGSPSWRTLVIALRSAIVNREDVASDIAQKHKIALK